MKIHYACAIECECPNDNTVVLHCVPNTDFEPKSAPAPIDRCQEFPAECFSGKLETSCQVFIENVPLIVCFRRYFLFILSEMEINLSYSRQS